MELSGIGKLLIAAGGAAALAGALLALGPKIPWLGRLPGDLVVRHEGFTLFIPLATMIVISVVLTVLLNLIFRFVR